MAIRYTAGDIGKIVRNARKKLGVTQRDLALTAGTGLRFIIDLERGKPTCQLEKTLTVLNTLGIQVDLTPSALDQGHGQKPRRDAVEILEARGVDYAVVGAMAMAVHGVVRASLDADPLVRASPGQFDGLAREFADRGLRTDLRRGEEGGPIRAVLEISDSHENTVDLIAGLRGVRSAVFRRAVGIGFEGSTIRVVAREDLIAMKLFAGGPVDFAGDELNLELLRTVTPDYGPDAVANLDLLLSAS